MRIEIFQEKLKEISPAFTIVPNNNRPGLSNIFYNGANYDLPVIDSNDVPDEPDQRRRYEFPNGFSARLNSVPEIVDRLTDFLKKYESNKELYED